MVKRVRPGSGPAFATRSHARVLPGLIWVLSALGLAVAPAHGAGLTTSGQYILGFVRYVSWPREDSIAAWQICIADGVATDQDRVYAGEIVDGKRFVVRHVSADDSLTSCQVLDLTGLDSAASADMLLRVRHMPVLTVGSEFRFCSQGGLICLRLHDGEPKFEVNLSAVKGSGLNISAKLLRLGSSPQVTSEHP